MSDASSIEKLIGDSKEPYYETLGQSTEGWHSGKHDLGPWTGYFLEALAHTVEMRFCRPQSQDLAADEAPDR